MASDERKQQILDHLAFTSNNLNFERKPQKLEYVPPPILEPSSRVMEHVSRTSNLSMLKSEQRKQQIMKHVRQSKG